MKTLLTLAVVFLFAWTIQAVIKYAKHIIKNLNK